MISTTGSNDLLTALPLVERNLVLEQCEYVILSQDDVLSQPGDLISHVYFPLDSFILLLTELDQHDAMGVGLIGSEGMLGVSLAQGVGSASLRARVQGAGSALRMKAVDFQSMLAGTPVLAQQLGRYVHFLLAQLAQTATCADFHVVELRLACWLLMIHDRAHGDRFNLTHHQLARMLGVRRSGLSTAAHVLQGRKLITYTRGRIAIRDRQGLERAACSCYRAERDQFKLIVAGGRNNRESKLAHVVHRPAHKENERGVHVRPE